MTGVVTPLLRLLDGCRYTLSARLTRWTKPLTSSLPLQTLADLGRSKSELVAENTLLRQQLIILKRQVKRPACTKTDRLLLVLLARLVRTWKQALFIVEPNQREMIEIGRLVEAGKLRPFLDTVIPWPEAPAAYSGKVKRQGRGKLVVAVGDMDEPD